MTDPTRPAPPFEPPPQLRRTLSLGMLTLYGLGTTIGAGIFVLVGKVAGIAGGYAPLAFLAASLLAGLSAFSFAALAKRFPESAGEAAYVREGLRSLELARLVGLFVVAAGVISSAAIVNGVTGYIGALVALDSTLSVVLVVGFIAGVAAVGIGMSVAVAAVISVAEIGALIVIVGAGVRLEGVSALAPALPLVPLSLAGWTAVLSAAVLAFYAFIGFEDIVNVAEETRDAERTLPLAILLTLVFTLLLYVCVALVAGAVVPAETLAASGAPLVLVFERATGLSGDALAAVATVSVLNGALIQIIMAARVLYGMGRRGMIPAAFGRVNARTRTPLISTGVVGATILVLALALPIETLARTTSFVALSIFVLVNASLIAIQRREGAPVFRRLVPALAAAASAGLLGFQVWEAAAG
jgi:APA family basic amino acid/polyamine antiporter